MKKSILLSASRICSTRGKNKIKSANICVTLNLKLDLNFDSVNSVKNNLNSQKIESLQKY